MRIRTKLRQQRDEKITVRWFLNEGYFFFFFTKGKKFRPFRAVSMEVEASGEVVKSVRRWGIRVDTAIQVK